MKTSSRLLPACAALALLLTSVIVTAAPSPQTSSAGARARARQRAARRRAARPNTNAASTNTAGTPPAPSRPISGGVLNGKAISKPQPVYPPIARAARASGTVVVQITVDEEGNVIAASAVSGHPLLRQSAVSAARQARFSPTLLSGQPVKVTGVVTYNFVLQ